MRHLAALTLAGSLLAGPLAALTPCVGVRFETGLEGAVDVERRFTDVPSARVAGLWQEGRVDGLVYRIASDRTGMVADEIRSPRWRIDIQCDRDGGDCHRMQTGSVPDAARGLADRVSRCILGDLPVLEELAGPSPDPAVELPNPPPDEPAAGPSPAAAVRPTEDVATAPSDSPAAPLEASALSSDEPATSPLPDAAALPNLPPDEPAAGPSPAAAVRPAQDVVTAPSDPPAAPLEASAPRPDEPASSPPPDAAAKPADDGAAGPSDVPNVETTAAPQETANGPAYRSAVGPARAETTSESPSTPAAVALVAPRRSTPVVAPPAPVSGSLPVAPSGACCAPWPADTGNQVRTLQILLAEAGFDAGPIDGEMGPRTRTALVAAFGPEAAGLAPSDAIIKLAALRCAGG